MGIILLGVLGFFWACYNVYEAICVWDAGWSMRPCKHIDNFFVRGLLHVAGAPGAFLGMVVGILTFKWRDWV